MAKHARSWRAKANLRVLPFLGLLGLGAGTSVTAVGAGLLQGLAWGFALLASPLASLLVGLGYMDRLDMEDTRRVFELQLKLNASYLVGVVLAYLAALVRAPLAQSGVGLLVATLVAVTSWTLFAELISVITWNYLRRRHES